MKSTTAAKEKQRFALLMAARDSEYVKKIYGGYYGVFVAAFGEEGERWDVFSIVDGEFPETAELGGYDGFVVSGSPHDAYGDDLWILKLRVLLRTLDSMKKRVLGICFGHQVISIALGGKVGKAHAGWDIGMRSVYFVEGLTPCRFLEDLDYKFPSSASILQVHQDEVWELPIGAKLIAFSNKTGVEMFIIEDHILGIQGHPEYSKDILLNIIDRLVDNNNIDSTLADGVRERVEVGEPDREVWVKICKSFLKGQ